MPLPRVPYVLSHNDIKTNMKYINIKQKEATDWIRENFVIALPKKAQPQPVETALPPGTIAPSRDASLFSEKKIQVNAMSPRTYKLED